MMKTSSIALTLFLAGCAAHIHSGMGVTFVAPDGVRIDSLAILPVTTGTGLGGYRHMTDDSLYAAITRERPGIAVIAPETTLRTLNESGLTDRYAQMMVAYEKAGVVDPAALREIGQALGVRHLLQVRVAYTEQTGVSAGAASGVSEVDRQRLEMHAHLLDTARLAVVWEAAGGASATAGAFWHPREVPEILAAAALELAGKLPTPHDGG